MQTHRPSAAHERLDVLLGEWRGTETLHPSPMTPDGGAAAAHVLNEWAMDGLAVLQHYEQAREGGVNFRGLGVMRFDGNAPVGEQYVMHWYDSLDLGPSEFRGDFDGDTLVLSQQATHGYLRAVWDWHEANRYRYRMDASPDGIAWFPVLSGEYSRVE